MIEPISNDQALIRKLTEIIFANIQNENFGVKELAHEAGISIYRLNRKLNAITNKTSNQLIREVRLQKALEMLQDEKYSVSEISYKCGFGSPGYFNKCFHDFYGFPPGKLIKNDSINQQDTPERRHIQGNLGKILRRNLFLMAGVMLFAVVFSMLAYFIFRKEIKAGLTNPAKDDARISLVVMPFRNMTNDTTWNIWREGIQTSLITALSNTEELRVRQLKSVNANLQGKGVTNYDLLTPSIAGKISQILGANIFVYGGIYKTGSAIRINAQLVNSGTEKSLKSFQISGSAENIWNTIDSLSVSIKNFLLISKLKTTVPSSYPDQYASATNNPEAYKYYIYGLKAYYKDDFSTAKDWFMKAITLDSNLVGAMAKISTAYYNENNFVQGKYWFKRYYRHMDIMTMEQKIWAEVLYAVYFETLNDRIKHIRQLIHLDDQQPIVFFQLGDCYFEMSQYEKAIPEFQKALAIFKKWGIEPYWGAFYYELGISYHKTGQYRKEEKLYRKADKDFPDDPGLMDQHAWLALTLGDTAKAARYIEKWTSVRKEQSWSDARIAAYLSYVYDIAGMQDEAEYYLRRALSLEPENTARISSLAYYLIDNSRNIVEGIDLIEKVLESDPENFESLHVKGWGYYKIGNIREAFDLLEKSWELRMQNSIYNHKAFLHLEEAGKALKRKEELNLPVSGS